MLLFEQIVLCFAQTMLPFGQKYEILSYTQTTKLDKNNYSVELFDLDSGCTVILATYKGEKLFKIQTDTYIGETIPITVSEDFDTIKVMVWSNLTSLKPLCDVNSTIIE